MSVRTLAACTALLVTVACSSKQDANASNFEEAVTAGLASDAGMCRKISLEWPNVMKDSDLDAPLMTALSKAGLLNAVPVSVPGAWNQKFPGHQYTPSDEGKKYISADGTICYGKASLVKILNWDPVVSAGGTSFTKVYFTYHIDGLPEWASRADVQATFPNLATTVQGQERARMAMPMALTNGHWQKE